MPSKLDDNTIKVSFLPLLYIQDRVISIGNLTLSHASGLMRYVYIKLRGIVYAVELLGKQYHRLYKPTVLFCSTSEPSSFPIAAILVRKHAGM